MDRVGDTDPVSRSGEPDVLHGVPTARGHLVIIGVLNAPGQKSFPVAVETVVMPGGFELTMDELRVVVRFAVEGAQEALPIFEHAVPDDTRPRTAVDAAWMFAAGAARTNRQRLAAIGAHRAAREATSEAARLAAGAAGDAAAAAYLHPIAKATQVGHILRAVANAAHAAEVTAGDDPEVGNVVVAAAAQRATPVLVDVLCRYPPAPVGRSRVAQLMKTLDTRLRTPGTAYR